MRRIAGFTWIEMLIVLAVIALLSLMAIPSLRDRALRRQVEEGLKLADVPKPGVQAVWAATGAMPSDNQAAGAPAREKIVGSMVKEVGVDHGAITVTFGNNASNALQGKRITVRPAVVPDERAVPIAWLCHGIGVPKGMQVLGNDETDLPPQWLPVDCRGAPAR